MGDGVPDLLVCRGAKLALVEVKMPKGKLTPEQERFLERGWPVFVLRDVEAAMALVRWLRELEQTCEAQADAYEGDYLAWLERAEAAHHAIAALATPPETPSEPSAIVASGLVETVREWQEARRPAQLTEPGVDLALTYQAAVKRMTAADEALAAYDLSGPSAPTPATARRCNGCGHEWSGAAPVILCGNCWLKCWPFVFGGVRCRLEQAEADVARLTEQVREWRTEAEAAGDRARAECALRREVEAERDASLATATEAAETVARLTAERDAARLERDSAREQFDRHVEWASQQEREVRAQAWAEAVAVVEQERERFTKGSDLSTVYAQYSVRDSFDAVLAALHAKAQEQP